MAEKFNAPLMRPCNIARNPHHFANKMGFEEFFDRLNPDYWLVSNHFHTTQSDVEEIDVYTYRTSYIFKYLAFNQDTTNIITNISQNVYFQMRGGTVLDVQGHFIDKDYDPKGDEQATYSLWHILPPGYYNECPYKIYTISLEEWFTDCYRLFNGVMAGANFYIQAWNESSTLIANTQIARDIRSYFLPYVQTALFYIWLDYRGLRAMYNAFAQPYASLLFWYTDQINYTFQWQQNTPANNENAVIEGEYANSDSVGGTSWNLIRVGRMLECTLDSGAKINLCRTDGYPESNNAPYSAFDGLRLATNGTNLYHVYISASGIVSVSTTNLVDGSVDTTTRKVTKLRPIM